MTIPDDVIEDCDPAEVGHVGCLEPTGDAVTSGSEDSDD
jgi:hypothetical protein